MMRLLGGCLGWLLIFLLSIPLYFVAAVKLGVIIAARVVRPQLRTLSSQENTLAPIPNSVWGSRQVVNFGYVLVVQGRIGVDELRTHFANCFLKNLEDDRYDKFLSYLVYFCGYVFRTVIPTCELHLEDHILEKVVDTEETFEDFVAKWLVSGYQVDKPWWEIIVVPNGDHSTKIGFKIHHAFADGYSILHILDRLTNTKSPYLVKDFSESWITQAKQMIEAPLNMGKMFANPELNPFPVNLHEGRHQWKMSFTTFPLQQLKELRRQYNVHMSSVILAIVSGGLRKFYENAHQDSSEIPEDFSVGITVPWPRHPSRTSQVSNSDKMCNHWVVATFQVPLRETNPVTRLKAIDANFRSFTNAGMEKFYKLAMLPLLWPLPASVFQKMMAADIGFGAGLTSLVGGDNYKLLDCPINAIHPILCTADISAYLPLSIFTFSHDGKMNATFGAHPSVFKDQIRLDNLAQQMCHDEFKKFL